MLKPFYNKKKNIDDRLVPAVTAADAGKFLGVTEDGKIAPVEGGSEQLYIHAINITSSANITWLSGPYCIFINTKSTPYTFAEFRDLVATVNTGGADSGYLLRFNGAISLKAFNVPYTIVNPAPTVSEFNTTRLYMAGTGFNLGDGTTNPTMTAFNTVRSGSEYFTAISDVVKPYPFE